MKLLTILVISIVLGLFLFSWLSSRNCNNKPINQASTKCIVKLLESIKP